MENTKKINVLSLFDGMSCGQIALNKVGIEYENYFASEIKPHAIQVTQHNYPNTVQVGDITKLNGKDLPKIDLLIGGSPCQDFSRANRKQEGLEGEKSGLFWEYIRLLKETNPTYFLLENVRMKQEWQDIISEELGVKPVRINSSLVSGAMRDRFYWTNIPMDGLPQDKGILLSDIIDTGFTEREKCLCLLESYSRPMKTPSKIARRYFKYGFWQVIFKDEETYKRLKEDYELATQEDVRYLNKEEMERAQTVPVGYTELLSRNDAACLLGDGWTVDVIAHIFEGLKNELCGC
jgi:site-specific DNA-cytosine methylase